MSQTTAYQKFAEMMLDKDSQYIPRILKCMITDKQAELLVSMPGTAAQMAQTLDRAVDDIQVDLNDLFHRGLAFKKKKNDEVLWRAPAHIAQFHDASILWPEAPAEFYDLWSAYMELEWPRLAPVLTERMPRPFTRVIPVGKSVDAGKVQVLAPENVREIIESAGRLAVTQCTCRLTMRKCDAPVEVCLQINRGAEYTIERGSGREVTKKEALKIIADTEEAGLVHVTMNKAGVGHFICNCCGCCCQSFTLLIADSLPICDPSRYRPEVNIDVCSGCGTCEERCWFDAISVSDDQVAAVIADKCLGCGQCAIGCPEEAIRMIEVREPDFIPE
ncbi:MAG: 4Fe-4S dicluster domain-containing protein [Desulfobacterales bacterium]|jgi:Pyruvate/2-oxoacid:ferredoxin oxidoreductase delta subunit